ncbi:hypothetical protein [Sporosarcina sp. NPDC096371]|uniref:hypothetical protein n=1 Tax=Sporosarcina sp. NPDC096371 TaxID=3364530 RepID=UPI003818344C
MGQIGLQLWSIREEVEKDLLGMLEKVAAMGYSAVQFAGFFNHPAEEVKRKLLYHRSLFAGKYANYCRGLSKNCGLVK